MSDSWHDGKMPYSATYDSVTLRLLRQMFVKGRPPEGTCKPSVFGGGIQTLYSDNTEINDKFKKYYIITIFALFAHLVQKITITSPII